VRVPASRSTRKQLKQGRIATAAEWRLRAEMGEEVLVPSEAPVSHKERKRRAAQRAVLREAFECLSRSERQRQADTYRRKLRALCPTAKAFEGAWTGGFAPLLGARAPRSARTEQKRSTADAEPETSNTAASAQVLAREPKRLESSAERAGRVLELKLDLARARRGDDASALAEAFNRDRQFVTAFGGGVTPKQIRRALGQTRGG
jgi:hypothetical protein